MFLDALVREAGDARDWRWVCERLGIDALGPRKLAHAGAFAPLVGPVEELFRGRRYSAAEVEEFAARVIAKATRGKARNVVTLAEAVESWPSCDVPWAEVFGCILDGGTNVFLVEPDERRPLLERIAATVPESERLLALPSRTMPACRINTHEAAALLRTNEVRIAEMMRDKILPSNGDKDHKLDSIEVASFARNHVLTREAASLLGCRLRDVRVTLADAGVQPAYVFAGTRCVYSRPAVMAALGRD